MGRMDAHEFRVWKDPNSPVIKIAIYHCTNGVESGESLEFPNQEAALAAVDNLRKMVMTEWPQNLSVIWPQ